MARIPRAPVQPKGEFQGARLTGMPMDALTGPGKALMGLGAALNRLAAENQAEQDRLNEYQFKLGAEQFDNQQRMAYAEEFDNSAPDGSDFWETRRANFQKAYGEWAGTLKTPEQKQRAQLLYERMLGDQQFRAYGAMKAKRGEYYARTIEETANTQAIDGYTDREDLDAKWSRLEAQIDASGLDDAQRAAIKEMVANKYFVGPYLQADPRRVIEEGSAPATAGLVDRIIGVESGGKANAKNPRSSASGLGQFIDSTWMQFLRERHPGRSVNSDALSLKNDPTLAREAVEWYAAKNADYLRSRGLPTDDGSLYLAHFAGPDGAAKLLQANQSASAESVLGSGVIKANPFLKGMTAGKVVDWAAKKMGATAGVRSAAQGPFRYMTLDTYNRARKAGQAVYARELDDYAAYLRAGHAPVADKYSYDEIGAVLDPDMASAAMEKIARARAYGADVNATRWATPAELAEQVRRRQSEMESPEGFQENAQDMNGLLGVIRDRNKQIADDPAAYVMQDPDVRAAYEAVQSAGDDAVRQEAMQRYADAAMARQATLGLPREDRRLLPVDVVAEIGRGFRDQEKGGQNAAFLVRGLADQWGAQWPRVLGELSKELPGTALVIAAMDRPEQMRAAETLAEAALVGKKALEDLYPNEDVRTARETTADMMAEFRETLLAKPGGENTALTMQDGVYTLALAYMGQGMDAQAAASRAYDDVIGKRYVIEGSYRVPVEHDAGAVGFGADVALRDFDPEGLDIPVSMAGLPPAERRDAYLSNIRSRGAWVTSSDESGLTLYDEQRMAVTINGEPYTLTWDELTRAGQGANTLKESVGKTILDALSPVTEPSGEADVYKQLFEGTATLPEIVVRPDNAPEEAAEQPPATTDRRERLRQLEEQKQDLIRQRDEELARIKARENAAPKAPRF